MSERARAYRTVCASTKGPASSCAKRARAARGGGTGAKGVRMRVGRIAVGRARLSGAREAARRGARPRKGKRGQCAACTHLFSVRGRETATKSRPRKRSRSAVDFVELAAGKNTQRGPRHPPTSPERFRLLFLTIFDALQRRAWRALARTPRRSREAVRRRATENVKFRLKLACSTTRPSPNACSLRLTSSAPPPIETGLRVHPCMPPFRRIRVLRGAHSRVIIQSMRAHILALPCTPDAAPDCSRPPARHPSSDSGSTHPAPTLRAVYAQTRARTLCARTSAATAAAPLHAARRAPSRAPTRPSSVSSDTLSRLTIRRCVAATCTLHSRAPLADSPTAPTTPVRQTLRHGAFFRGISFWLRARLRYRL